MNIEVSKKYGIVLMCLGIASMLILIFTFFVPIFKLDLGFVEGAETAADFFLLTQENTSEVVENVMLRFVYALFSWSFWGVPGFLVWESRKVFSDLGREKFNETLWDDIKGAFVINLLFYLLTLLVLFAGYDWNVMSVLSGDSLVKTEVHIPLIFQSIIFVVALFVHSHWKKALAGEVKPFSFGWISLPEKKNKDIETIELLAKYKELYDGDVITETEFNEKKRELLMNSERAVSIGKNDERGNVELIAKYKELFDNQIISEQEYLSKKEELLSKRKK